jgi:hypothetical protein
MHPVLCALKQQAALQFSESCLGDFGWPEVGDFEVAIGDYVLQTNGQM